MLWRVYKKRDIVVYNKRMRRVRNLLCIFVGGLLFGVGLVWASPIWAHPIDITRTELTVLAPDENEQAITLTTTWPWVEAAALVKEETIDLSSIKQLSQYLAVYELYLQENLVIKNDGNACRLANIEWPDQKVESIITGGGIILKGRYECAEVLGTLDISNRLFVEIFPLQNNIVHIYKGNQDTILSGGLLTKQNTEMRVDVVNPDPETRVDSPPRQTLSAQEQLDSLTLAFMDKSRTSLPLALGIAFLLGLLHTLEAGHSKTVLAAMVTQRGVEMKQGLMYAAVFTVTHVADILFLGGLLLIADAWFDVFEILPYLQIVSAYGLLFLAFYMVVSNVGHLLQRWWGLALPHDHDHALLRPRNFRQQLLAGFISGLAPCLFGWSVFMMVVSTRQLWAVFPVIAAFGLGIGAALAGIVCLLVIMKSRLLGLQSWIGEIAPLISALLLLGFAWMQVG